MYGSMIIILKKIYQKWPILTFDFLAIPLAWYLAFGLRFNLMLVPPELFKLPVLNCLAITLVVQIICYYYFKVYRGLWCFVSLDDLSRIVKAVLMTVFIVIPMLYLLSLLQHIPRSIIPLYGLSLIFCLCSGRILRRYFFEYVQRRSDSDQVQRVIIIGAGRAGESLIRDLKRFNNYKIVGILDDAMVRKGAEVHGIRVLGSIKELPYLAISHKVNLIFIAIPSAGSSTMRRIVNYCEATKIPFRTLPTITAIVDGRVEINDLREVSLEDLLGRDPVHLEWDKIISSITNKRVLITGGGGSIGAELCRQVAKLNPEKLIIIDNSEYNLYQIDLEMRERFPEVLTELALISVTDEIAIDAVFHRSQPDIIFHAAAYKHVPLLEGQIREAVLNNIIGTKNVAEASVNAGVKKFILISSDKAVNPTNVMGATKRVAEIYCQNLNAQVETQFITVRFGNVLGSAGSVIPLFQKQLQAGGPLTVTHPDIQRYFMTIPEACQLILQAMVNGHGGEIFVLDMGEPIKIKYLAEQMILLAGKKPGIDIMIKYIGLRPGEKLYEELFHSSERLAKTTHAKLFKAKFRQINWSELVQTMQLLKLACMRQNARELQIIMKTLVPEFSFQAEIL